MPRRDEVTRKASLAEMTRIAEAPEFTRVRSRLLVHDRSTTAGACPCCGSETAKVVEELPDLDLILDTTEGARYLRHTFP